MQNDKIRNQFKTMGNLIIAQTIFAVIMVYSLSKCESLKDIDNLYIVGSVIQIVFFIAYVNWWFVTGELFSNTEKDTNLEEDKNKTNSQSTFIKVIIILVIMILAYAYSTW
jgi:Na+/H+ antiporter NhaD/arsenite permease-like protein